MELGAFYPFSRNHNDIKSAPQEPYLWPSVAAISRKVLGARYAILAYLNTLFYHAHTDGGTVARPLFFEFVTDIQTVTIDTQFMLGPALLISPCLTQGATTVSAYLPPSTKWYDFWTWQPAELTGPVTLQAPIDVIPVHVRGGTVLPMQNSTGVMSTVGLVAQDFNLVVALDATGSAQGDLFLDDGLNLEMQNYFYGTYTLNNQVFDAAPQSLGWTPAHYYWIESVSFLGVTHAPSTVQYNGAAITTWTYATLTQSLTVNVEVNLVTPFTITWAV